MHTRRFHLLGTMLLATVCAGLSWSTSTQAALDEPTLAITSLKTETDRTTAMVKFTVNDTSLFSNIDSLTVDYKRSDQTDYILNKFYASYSITADKNNQYYLLLDNLLPNTAYTFRLALNNYNSEDPITTIGSFTTRLKKRIKITTVFPTTVRTGDTITIYGQGFGNKSGRVELGYSTDNLLTVVSWSSNKITAKINDGYNYTDGPVVVKAFPFPMTRFTNYAKSARSPEINVINESHSFVTSNCWPGVVAKTYDAIKNFDDLYLQAYGRHIQCNELTFHLQRTTPHDTLKTWLAQQIEAEWWNNLHQQHNNEVLYGANKTMYFVHAGKLYRLTNFMTAIAWGLNLDQAHYDSSFSEALHQATLVNAPILPIWPGPYYREALAISNGETVTFENDTFDQYVNANVSLLQPGGHSSTATVCKYVNCGVAY